MVHLKVWSMNMVLWGSNMMLKEVASSRKIKNQNNEVGLLALRSLISHLRILFSSPSLFSPCGDEMIELAITNPLPYQGTSTSQEENPCQGLEKRKTMEDWIRVWVAREDGRVRMMMKEEEEVVVAQKCLGVRF